MILAAVDDASYNIFLFLHILTAMVAFAPAFVHPFLSMQMKNEGLADRPKVFSFMATNAQRIYGTSLLLTGLLGFGVAGMSDEVYKMSQGWLMASILVWIAMNGILHAVIRPSEKEISSGNSTDAVEQKLAVGGMTITILLIVQLYLMIWKPGF